MLRKRAAGERPPVGVNSELLGTLDTHSSDLIHSGSVHRTKNEHMNETQQRDKKKKTKYLRRPSSEVRLSVSEESSMTHHEICHPVAGAS